jgi:hypothetical protein
LPLLYAAANVMAAEGDSHDEIKENFLSFVEGVIEKQRKMGNPFKCAERPPRKPHPFQMITSQWERASKS